MIQKAYEAFDNCLMKGVNAGVRAYNWTTGGTKADLANQMLSIAPVMESIKFTNWHPVNLVILVPVFLLHSHFFQSRNLIIEKKETMTAKHNLMSQEVESYKNFCEGHGNSLVIVGGINFYLDLSSSQNNGYFLKNREITDYCGIAGLTLRGGSFYAMRADNLPPRKNCLSRGLDKLTEIVREYQGSSQPVPLPA